MISTYPFVSIIIPTRNRCHLLPRTFAALSRQTYPADRIELLLVADGCTDGTVEYTKQYTGPWKLQTLEQPGLGLAAARNRGAYAASGELLVFLDDDMEVVPEFVAAHVQVHQGHPKTIAVGSLISPQSPTRYFERSLQDWWEDKFFRMRQPGHRFRYDDLFGGNFSIQTDFFSQSGGFDPNLRCREDYELMMRLFEAGAVCELAVTAIACHHDATDLARSLRRRTDEGRADVYIAQHHPAMCEQMPLGKPPFTLFSRILRFLAFRQPSLGTRIVLACQRILPLLEALWLFRYWQALFYHLQDYWYWHGVSMAISLDMFRKLFLSKNDSSSLAIIDLAAGIDVAEKFLDANRPADARLFVGKHWAGDILGLPGLERLRGNHLKRILATDLSWQFSIALNLYRLLPASKDRSEVEAWQKAWCAPTGSEELPPEDIYRLGSKKVIEINLENDIQGVDVNGYTGLHALIRAHGQPLGFVTLAGLDESRVPEMTLYQSIVKHMGHLFVHTTWSPLPAVPETWTPISVIVCTRNRTDQLAGCLQSLIRLDYPQFEIIVVDNAPDDEQTAKLATDLPVRYICENRPGLDWARNRGLQEAQYPIVAFTDDDARPDRGWLRAIAGVFNDPEVMAVTGSVLPAELETPAQNLFEFEYGGMNHGFRRQVIRRTTSNNVRLLWASGFGVGANMAFRKKVFAEIGGFDVALDVGTPSSGGGDVEMFHRLVARGHTLVYEPAAIVWHHHRREMTDLEQLVKNNGRSFGCYLLTNARNRTINIFFILYFFMRYWLWDWIGKRLLDSQPPSFPRHLVWQELLAALGSPLAYLRSQAQARRYTGQRSIFSIESVPPEKVTR